jgi:hypothetical protein
MTAPFLVSVAADNSQILLAHLYSLEDTKILARVDSDVSAFQVELLD